MAHFTKEGNNYVYWVDEERLYETTEIAVAYSVSDWGVVMHKHGKPKLVYSWVDHVTSALIAAGEEGYAMEYATISSDKWPLEELNKIVQISGYMERFLKEVSQGTDTMENTPIKCGAQGSDGKQYWCAECDSCKDFAMRMYMLEEL